MNFVPRALYVALAGLVGRFLSSGWCRSDGVQSAVMPWQTTTPTGGGASLLSARGRRNIAERSVGFIRCGAPSWIVVRSENNGLHCLDAASPISNRRRGKPLCWVEICARRSLQIAGFFARIAPDREARSAQACAGRIENHLAVRMLFRSLKTCCCC
jgi:hypothetical protein